MRIRIATIVAGLAMLCVPAAAGAQPAAEDPERDARGAVDRAPHEERYLDVRERYIEAFGLRAAGRDIVRDGYREDDGDVRPARRAEVVESIERMERDLAPAPAAAEEPVAEAPAEAAPAPSGGSGLAATAQCESGGDYGAVNPAGYYGAYQFDQRTWDAYAPEGYAGTNPAEAPPAVQDAAAASVDYNAWPNCPSP